MLFITGDIHGDSYRITDIAEFCKRHNTTLDDHMIILGDVGINFYGDLRDELRKTRMSQIPITFVCIRGNHEMRPSSVSDCRETSAFGGLVYQEKNAPNIFWLKDGHTYDIEGKRILAIGGAYSIDKFYRLYCNKNWFADEQLTQEEMDSILERVSGQRFDIVISHTCPVSWEPKELFLSNVDQSTVDKSMENWLEEVKNSITFDKWYFGHYHGEKANEKYELLYTKIKTIE